MLAILRHIMQEVSRASTLAAVLQITVEEVRKAIEADACSILLVDRQHHDFVLMATDGLNPECIGKTRISSHHSLVGFVAERGEPINLENAPKHPRFQIVNEVAEEHLKAFLGVPIIHQRRILGVLMVQQEESRQFDEAEEAFLVTLSLQLAGTIAHAEATGFTLNIGEGSTQIPVGTRLTGIPSANGIGIGIAMAIFPLADLDAIPHRAIDDPEKEINLFEAAVNATREEITELSKKIAHTLPREELALFEVYLRILDNSSLNRDIKNLILTDRTWAQYALCQVVKQHIQQFQSMEDPYLSERANDIHDLGCRVLSHLQAKQNSKQQYPAQTILIGENIAATDLALVPEGQLVGIISANGSSNSHVAILARAMSVPTIMGVRGLAVSQLEGRELIVDGYAGEFYISPSLALRNEFTALQQEERELEAELALLRDLPAQTVDGYHISLCVNTGLINDVTRALSVGAEGVGLYRTEMPFIIRDRFPSEKEQRVIYQQLLAAFSPRPVIMRTLDIGGDKMLSYLPIEEANPFLGWRGIRVTLDHPDVFIVQLRAMLRANNSTRNLRILFPMITSVNEIEEALRLLTQAHQEVLEEGRDIPMPPVGIMIEVPSAIYQTRAFARRVDFLSVGTNDLTQYLLAVDRNNPRVANLFDSFHPSVLQALRFIAENAHKEGKVVSICGEMASDPAAVILLLAMGFDSLSMNASSLPRIKWIIRNLTMAKAHELLDAVFMLDKAEDIRAYLEFSLEQLSLNSIIRSGRK